MKPSGSPRVYPILIFVCLALVLGYFAFQVLEPFIAAAAWALVFAGGFYSPWVWIKRRFPKRQSLAAVLMSLAVALVVLLPATLFSIVLMSQAADAIGKLGQELASRNLKTAEDFARIPAISEALDRVQEATGLTPAAIQEKGVEALGKVSGSLAGKSAGFVKGLMNVILTFVMTIFLLFFFFRDGDAMVKNLSEILPVSDESRTKLVVHLRSMLQSIFKGSFLCALIQGLTGAIGWVIAGLPSPAVAGAAMALFSLLPVGGTALVWGPGAIWLWISGHHAAAIFLVIWGAVVVSTLADNVLKPILIGQGAELHTLEVFLGVFGGIGAFGLLGVFFGPILLALVSTLLGILRDESARSVALGAAASGEQGGA